jgi:hypothetical protein
VTLSFLTITMPKTIVYIDGFNLYYGLLRRSPYKWLDLVSLFADHVLLARIQLMKSKIYAIFFILSALISCAPLPSASPVKAPIETFSESVLQAYQKGDVALWRKSVCGAASDDRALVGWTFAKKMLGNISDLKVAMNTGTKGTGEAHNIGRIEWRVKSDEFPFPNPLLKFIWDDRNPNCLILLY